ncbi:MAG: TonB-dependent receptor [Bacteroidetes bacterium]|nr:TonB-dependent receptor [Bacteroidota bacterium]
MNKLSTLLLVCLSFTAMAQSGIIRGRIAVAGSNAPLDFATVALDGTTIGTQTDEKGEYEFKDLQPGFYNVKISSVGYTAKTVYEVEVTNSKPAIVNAELESSTEKLKEVEVTTGTFQRKEESPVSIRTIGVNEIQRYPGGNRDISRVIQSLPGVGVSTGFRNDLIIRGGSTAENKFYLDDIEIPNINHFVTQGGSGGPQGLINVDFIREVNFYSSAFPADRGNVLSSVMDIRLRDGREDRWGAAAALGITDAALSAEGPLDKKKKATLLLSWRSSYYDWFFKLINVPIFPNYNDGQVKLRWKITPKDELTFLSLNAIDIFRLNLNANKTEENRYLLQLLPVNNQQSTTNGLKYTHFFTNSYLQAVVSSSELFNQIDKYKDNSKDSTRTQYYRSTQAETKARLEWTKRSKGWKINVGGNLEWDRYYNRSQFQGTYFRYDYLTRLDIYRYGVFSQVSKTVAKDRLTLSLGMRLDGNTYNESMLNPLNQLSPRFALSYTILERLRLNFNTGYYHETPAYTVMGYRDTTGALVNQKRLTYMRNIHVVAGIEYTTKYNSRISVEGFFKQYYNVPFLLDDSISLANQGSNFGVVGNAPAQSTNKGRSYGGEFLFEQKLYKGWFGILSYTLFWSQFQDKYGVYQSSSWDTRHIISLTAGKKFKRNWELGARWRVQGGSPYTPYDIAYSTLIPVYTANPGGVFDYNRQNSLRLPWFHQLDMRVTKKWYLKALSIELYLDIQNVYYHKQKQQDLFTIKRDANGQPLVDPSDPTRYIPNLLANTSGVLQPGLGLVISY